MPPPTVQHPSNDPGQAEPQKPIRPVRECAARTPQFKCMTINLNGIRTKMTKGKRRITKATTLRLYAQGESLDFIGIQEPHLYTSDDDVSVQSIFDTGFYHFVCHPTETGRGGAAIAVHYHWTVKHSFTVDDGILVAIVANAEGQPLTIVSAHFDHRPDERKDQWVELHRALQTCHFDDICLLADHNSLAHLPRMRPNRLPRRRPKSGRPERRNWPHWPDCISTMHGRKSIMTQSPRKFRPDTPLGTMCTNGHMRTHYVDLTKSTSLPDSRNHWPRPTLPSWQRQITKQWWPT